MKTIIRNFLAVVRRFKLATLLNILGLSVAFTAVIIIMMQVTYDLDFDGSQPEADNIYRIEAQFEGRKFAVIPRPFIESFKATSPHIKFASYSSPLLSDIYDWLFWVENGTDKFYYSAKVLAVSVDYVHIFRFDVLEGSADRINEPETALIPESMAKKMFGSESAIGQYLRDEEQKMLITGVYKDFPENSSTKNVIYTKFPDSQDKENWGNFSYEGHVLIDSSDRINEILDAYTKTIDPSVFERSGMAGVTFRAVPIKEIHFSTDVEFDSVAKVSPQTVWVLLAIAFVIMLIAAINFTNYSIALTPLRIKSINTQKVLGAAEGRLRSSLVIEAVLICLLAWIISIGLTHLVGMTSVSQIVSADMSLGGHWNVLSGMGVLALAVGVFAGIYPAFYVTSFTPALVLKGSFGLSPKGRQLRNGLVGVQFIASFALIVVSLFMYLQVQFMQHTSLGFDKDQIIVANLNGELIKSRKALSPELRSDPGIEHVSYAESLFSGLDAYSAYSRKFKGEENKLFHVLAVDTGFLQTMGIPLLEGRDLNISDIHSDGPAFIFNEKARKEFGLSVGDKTEQGEEIIGFVPDIKVTSLRKEIEPMAFMYASTNYTGGSRWAYIRVKAGSDLNAARQHVENVLHKFSPGFPFNIRIYDDILNNLYANETNLTSMIIWFSLIAVLISMVGVFGLVVFESEYKRKEVGVRKVLGSTTSEILGMINIRYIKILAICFILAAPIAYFAIQGWLQNFAYKTPIYWWVFAISFLMVSMLTTATVTFQSWQVANANPVDSIKTE